jgi:LmbE family N-acetylglucosaminyl deacetylase
MLGLGLETSRPLRLLVVGAHADDIEIGCGATVLNLLRENPSVEVDWVVVSARGERRDEAAASAAAYLKPIAGARVHLWEFMDGFFPYDGRQVKERFEGLKAACRPDLVLTHYRDDRHQDHSLVSDLTWNTFRDAVVLEYEIPKWDGDIGIPNLFVETDTHIAELKVRLLNEHFPSQHSRDWWDDETFLSIMRLRGIECRAASRLAEAFYARKLIMTPRFRKELCR